MAKNNMAKNNGIDLEAQLRRYADQVEASVEGGAKPLASEPRLRRPWILAGAAVVALVVGVLGLLVMLGEDESAPVETDRAGDRVGEGGGESEGEGDVESMDPETGAAFDSSEGEPGVDGWLPRDALLDAGPLSPRHSPAVVQVGDQVVVWGGSVAGSPSAALADGAVYDIEAGTWARMAGSPLPDNWSSPVAVAVGDRVLIAQGDVTAFYHPVRGVWSELSPAPFRIDEMAATGDGDVFGWGDRGPASFDRLTQTWTAAGSGDLTGFSRSDFVWTGDQLWAVRSGLPLGLRSPDQPGLLVEAWDPEAGVWTTLAESEIEGAYAFDVAWSEADNAALLVQENGAVARISPDGTVTSLPELPDSGYEGGPSIVRGHDGGLAVAWAPRVRRLTDGVWESAALPEGFGFSVLGRSMARDPLWTFGRRAGDTDGGNYFATIDIDELFEAENVPAGTCDDCVPLPNFVGMSESDAIRAAQRVVDAEFALTPIGDPTNGVVISQSPPAGTMVEPGRLVILTVAEDDPPEVEIRTLPGPVSVPGVVGLFADTAMVTLRNTGLLPIPEFRVVPFGDPQVGIVLEQSPAAFDELPPGSPVTIVIGEAGPAPEPTTTVP